MSEWPWIVGGALALLATPGALRLLRSRSPRRGLDFNLIDESIHHLDTEAEPWSVHVEARVAGTIDEARLRAAARSAAMRHPMARAFQRRWRPWHTVYEWGISTELATDPVAVATAASDEEVAEARSRFQSKRVPIDAAPPFRVLLVRHPAGDYVMLNFNHGASDGVGSLRLLRSIARAYGGEDDPTSEADDRAVRDLAHHSAPADFVQRWRRLALLRGALVDAIVAAPSRLAADGGDEAPGFRFVQIALDAETTARVAKRKLAGGTVNDLLLAVLHRTVQSWNDEHHAETGRVGTMMPVNLRPEARWTETVGNVTYFVSISTSAEERRTLAETTAAIVRQTKEIKEQGTAAALREILVASPALLLEVKRRLPGLLPFGGNRFVDTAVLSNVGRVAEPMVFGEHGAATEVWFSPPCRMPLGLGLGAATHGGRLFFSFRYRRSLWSEHAAGAFAGAYEAALSACLDEVR